MALGHKSVVACQASMSVHEAHDWYLFDQEEPLGNREIRHQLARMLSMVWNRWRAKGEPEVSSEDFMFRSPERTRELQVEGEQNKKRHMIAGLQALAAAQGPRVLKRRKKARK